MKANQIIVIVACFALLGGIYLFGNTKKPAAEGAGPMGGHMPSAQQAVPEALDIEAYLNEVKGSADKSTLQSIETAEKTKSYDALIEDYKKMDKPLAVAYYIVKQAEQVNTAKQYVSAGDFNSMLMQTAPDEKAHRFLAVNALNCYKKAVDLDTANMPNHLRLASAYMEEGSQPMSGVMLLLDAVKKDSNNIDALLLLGRYGLKSGQIDKAIARFEKILYLQPQNSDALYLMAQAYKDKNDKQKAIDLLERCMKTLKDTAAKNDIAREIESIKKPTS